MMTAEMFIGKSPTWSTEDHGQPSQVRDDKILWLSEDDAIERGLPHTAAAMTAFRKHIVRTVLSIDNENLLLPRRIMLSVYDGDGAHYSAHRDGQEPMRWHEVVECVGDVFSAATQSGLHQAATAINLASDRMRSELNHRRYTAILYLNSPDNAEDDWEWSTLKHGGALRCFVDAEPTDLTGQTATSVTDTSPTGGRCVVFSSREMLHAVQPSSRRRLAMTAWIFDDSIMADPEMSARCVGRDDTL